MTTACTTNQYFSGQGALLLAEKDPTTGEPTGFVPVGNVSALTIGIETTTFEHKESCSGVRGIDLEIVQEVNATAAFTMESLSKENLALALYGSSAAVAAGTASDELITLYHDKWMPLANINLDPGTLVLGDDATPTTTYTLGTDYLLNEAAGSIMALSTGAITDAQVCYADYDYLGHDAVQGLESGSPPIRWARFEGLNTADTDKPLVVDIFKLSVQPLAELALISDEISQMEIEAKALSDATRSSGSNYFRVNKVA
jgi:hypothetical protein